MNEKQAVPGAVVRSQSGHDKGRHYILIRALPSGCAEVSDGKYRVADNCKRKNLRHLYFAGLDSGVSDILKQGGKLSDEEIKRALKLFKKAQKKAED